MRIVPRIEREPALVRFAQTIPGKLLLLWVFAGGLVAHGFDHPWLRVAVLAATTFAPATRPVWLLVGALLLLYPALPFDWDVAIAIAGGSRAAGYLGQHWFRTAIVCVVAAAGMAYYAAADRWRDRGPLRRPVATLIAAYVACLCIASYAPLGPGARALAWALLVVAGPYLWFLAYSLADLSSPKTPPLPAQLGYYRPIWLGWNLSFVPFPKGAAYLRKIEAKTPEQLAVTQIKGVKLLYWALVLAYAKRLLLAFGYGDPLGFSWLTEAPFHLGAFTLDDALERSFHGEALAWHANWLALALNFAVELMSLSIWGHVIIATCRMAGYAALRNTYRPLQATSIADFWNRYYYYFKELMVEFFFYPTYLRYFRKQPKVRMLAATFAAAGLGNILYHYLYAIEEIAASGVWRAWIDFRVYWVYALVLATAIGVSQLRHGGRRPAASGPLRRVLISASVMLFYCVLSVFDDHNRDYGLAAHLRFLVHLVPGW